MDLFDNPNTEPVLGENAINATIEGEISLEDLYFSYDGEHNVLKDIELDVKPGEMIVIVGHTGSGKSTIINLLMRFYEYQQGKIAVDKRNIRDYTKDSLRSQIGLVQLDALMFYGDFYNNIRLHGDYTDEEVIEAAKFTGAHHRRDIL